MKKVIILGAAVALSVSVGCSKKTASTAVTISSIDQLPSATGPVSGGSSAVMRRLERELAGGPRARMATSGTNFYSANSSSFSSTSNRGMCELMNFTKELVDRAAQSDKVGCYVAKTVSNSTNSASLSTAGVDPYDGVARVYALDFGDGTTQKIKMLIAKTDGAISNFKMWGCFDGGSTQTEYISKVIGTDRTVSMVNKNIGGGGGNTWAGQIEVTGAIGDDGELSSKSMVGRNSFTSTAWNGTSVISMTQYSDKMKFSGFQTGSGSFGGQSFSNTNRIYSEFELIDSNTDGAYSLRKLAMGHGNYKATLSNTFNSTTSTDEVSEAWNGDTTATLSSADAGPYYAAVNAASVPATESVSVSFSGDEVWDCTGSAAATLTVNQSEIETGCNVYSLREEGADNYINCWNIMN